MVARDIDFSTLTVLVVDDQDYVRSIVIQLLKRLGVGTVLESSDGAEAMRKLDNVASDLVICDIKMAPVDGLQFLRGVRGGMAGTNPRIPIIFLTSAADRGTVLEAIENEIDGYIVKPVSSGDLRAKMVTVLSRRMSGKGPSGV